MKKQINFYKKLNDIHVEMVNAIEDLLREAPDNYLDLSENTGFACVSFVGRAEEIEITALKLEKDDIMYKYDDNPDEWYYLSEDVLIGTIWTLYESAYSALKKIKGKK